MKNLWNDEEAKSFSNDPLSLRVYTSRLLGREPDLVLHGGGNTSVKTEVKNRFGEKEEILFVKGSGWDLETIEAEGFAPVKLSVLKQMAELKELSDLEMVKIQRSAMIDPSAPNPSVEAILHAIIPTRYVDHTHADAIVTISNTLSGEKKLRGIYGNRVLLIPYVMPGFLLAKKVYQLTKNADWSQLEGMILMHHGIFTFHDSAQTSYKRMIRLVTEAENYLKKKAVRIENRAAKPKENLLELAKMRKAVSGLRKSPVITEWDRSKEAVNYSNLPKIASIASRGPITPDHIIRTKRCPVVIGKDASKDILEYARAYELYFNAHKKSHHKPLDSAPRFAIWPGYGLVSFGKTTSELQITSDINQHTLRAIQQAEALGGWRPLPEKELFEVEYWDLEQAKLKKNPPSKIFTGKAALVTGAASGIGKACVEKLNLEGAAVIALDIDPKVKNIFKQRSVKGLVCDVTNEAQVKTSIAECVRTFGGLDIVISNAGIFPPTRNIVDTESEIWNKSLSVNLTSHQFLLKACIPYLVFGIDPAVVVIASKNVPAPGPGASAYSAAKAGLTQLARVAALELASEGIRVNVIHPNQVFDTAIWTQDVLTSRANQYGVSVEEYKTSNLLKVEISSQDVAELACAMAGPAFSKTTGAQIPIDGGNERVI